MAARARVEVSRGCLATANLMDCDLCRERYRPWTNGWPKAEPRGRGEIAALYSAFAISLTYRFIWCVSVPCTSETPYASATRLTSAVRLEFDAPGFISFSATRHAVCAA